MYLKHGDSCPTKGRTSLYQIWCSMKSRCKEKSKMYYYGRGITVCDEWNEYENFKLWATENGYEVGLSIDRIDTNGNYEPSNCRWVTWKTQTRNRRNSTAVTINGETHSVPEWSEISGIKYCTLWERYIVGNFEKEVFLRPVQKRRKEKINE